MAMLNPQSVNFWQINKKLLALALPMSTVQFITMASNFLCMVMLAQLGHDVLAASALFFSTQMAVIGSGMSILFSLSVLIGHAYGAKEHLKIGNYVQQGWSLGLLISIPIILVFMNMDTILLAFKQSPVHAAIVQSYFSAYVWGVVPLMIAVCNQQLCYGTRKQSLVTITNLLCVVILIPTAYSLIYGKLGLPRLGVAGLGYALAIQNWFYFIFTTFCFYRFQDFKKFDLFRYRVHQDLKYLVKMFKMGWPISFQMGGEMLFFFLCATMIGWLGSYELAAYQVVNQYRFLIFIPIFAMSQACGVLVGHACGEKNFEEIKLLGKASILLTLIITSAIAIILVAFPTTLAGLYLNIHDSTNQEILHLVVILFVLAGFSQIVDGVRNVLTGSLRGILDTRYPMLIGLLSLWIIGLPLSYILAFPWHLGVIGVALGSTIGIFIGLMLLLHRWHGFTKNASAKLLFHFT